MDFRCSYKCMVKIIHVEDILVFLPYTNLLQEVINELYPIEIFQLNVNYIPNYFVVDLLLKDGRVFHYVDEVYNAKLKYYSRKKIKEDIAENIYFFENKKEYLDFMETRIIQTMEL